MNLSMQQMQTSGWSSLSGPLSPNLNTGSPSVAKTWILLFSYSATTIKHPSLEIQILVGILNSPSPLPCLPKLFTKFPVCTFNCCIQWLHSSATKISSSLKNVTSTGSSNCPSMCPGLPSFRTNFPVSSNTWIQWPSKSATAITLYCSLQCLLDTDAFLTESPTRL